MFIFVPTAAPNVTIFSLEMGETIQRNKSHIDSGTRSNYFEKAIITFATIWRIFSNFISTIWIFRRIRLDQVYSYLLFIENDTRITLTKLHYSGIGVYEFPRITNITDNLKINKNVFFYIHIANHLIHILSDFLKILHDLHVRFQLMKLLNFFESFY